MTEQALTLTGQAVSKGKKAGFTAHFYVSVEPGFEGDIPVTLSGGGLEEEQSAIAATVVAPVSVETSTTNFEIGLRDIETAYITITENAAGAIRKAGSGSHAASEAEEYADALVISIRDIKFENNSVKAEVTDGDLVIEKYRVINGELHITVKRSSSVPSAIKLTGGVIRADRTLPQGDYELRIGGAAVIGNYCSDPAPESAAFDRSYCAVYPSYVRIVTAAGSGNTTLGEQVAVTMGSTQLIIGENVIEMDTEPFIVGGNAMVPIRFIAQGIGLEDDDIVWDPINKTLMLNANGLKIQFMVDSNIMLANGMQVRMDTTVVINEDNRMFIPFRVLGDALGVNVSWDDDTKTAI